LGLEKFKHVVLGCRDLSTVDEVFRLFQNKYPPIKIEHTKAIDDVQFMVDRSLPSPE